MLLNRHRIAKLIELADLERRLAGPERLLREEDVALLVKAAYDDASEAARAAFMARVQSMPVTAWPWSAVQVKTARSGVVAGPGGRVTMGLSTRPEAVVPPALLLIRGEAETADAEPGDRLPERGTPEAALWEPLHRALDTWDTKSILAWVGPQGWMNPATTQVPKDTGNGATDGAPQGGGGGVKPANSYHPDIVVSGGDVVAATSGSKATSHKLAVASASLGDGKSADDSLPDCVVPPAAAANR